MSIPSNWPEIHQQKDCDPKSDLISLDQDTSSYKKISTQIHENILDNFLKKINIALITRL